MRSLKESIHAVVDLDMVILIGITFAALMVVGVIIWKIKDQLAWNTLSVNTQSSWNNSSGNITGGFDNAVNLTLVAITIFIRNMKKRFVFIVSGVISDCDFSIVNVKRQTINIK